MPATVICSRCEQEKPAQASAPMGGEVGQRVLENVCVDCWAEWRETSARIINHYGLVLGNPDHRAQLRVAMLQFLALDDEDDDDGAAASTDN
jgi:Fe-S cluster biosynthesis and repair protein YggX